MDELRRLRYVTERYPHLQGLRLIPLGLVFLVSAAWRDGRLAWVPGTSGVGAHLWFLGLLFAALAVAVAIGGYYRRRFGAVQPEKSFADALLIGVFVALLLGSLWAQEYIRPAISLPTLLTGSAVGYRGIVGGHIRLHYVALAALCLVFAMLGTFGVPYGARDVLFDDLIGIGLIMIGVGDHLLLRRTLEPVTHVEAF